MKLKRKRLGKKDLKKTLRMSQSEDNEIQLKANLYSEGNFSEWMIYASMNHRPKKSDLE